MDKKTILIADDSEINREELGIIFDEQYNILWAEDGEETIKLIEEHKDIISLMLLDLIMPKKDGFEVLAYMKESGVLSKINVIVITGSSDIRNDIKAYEYGASELIRKPFLPAIVKRRVENTLEMIESREILQKEVEAQNDTIKRYESYDKLTGLYNMQKFLLEADVRLKDAAEKDECNYSVIYGNICRFKFFNVKYGLKEGDKVLKEMADYISKYQPDDLNARFGNDHFITLSNRPDVIESAQNTINAFNDKYKKYGIQIKTGIYHIRSKDEVAITACDYAKIACDSITHEALDMCEYDENLKRKVDVTNYVIHNIDKAIENGYIKVYYQPVIRTINETICGMEALARWIDPEVGFLSPGDFITALEENKLITKLDLYILKESCRLIKSAFDKNEDIAPISFNLSRYDFAECDIFTEVEKIVSEYGVARDMINIEITESTAMDDPQTLKDIIAKFRNAGYQVWMDDFGSGYSSLNLLKDFEFDEIKLDMVFMRPFSDKSKEIVKSIISMAKNIGIKTLAEGVETKEQFDFLRQIGCERVQGYYYSPPKPYNELLPILNEKNLTIESRKWKKYYDAVGHVDFMSDRPVAIAEYDGENYTGLYCNEAYENVVREATNNSFLASVDYINSLRSSIYKTLRDYQNKLTIDGNIETIDHTYKDKYLRLNIQMLGKVDRRELVLAELIDISKGEIEEKKEQFNTIQRRLLASFDSVYLFNLDTNKAESVIKNPNYIDPADDILYENGSFNYQYIADEYIHIEDRSAFLEFVEPLTKIERLRASHKGQIVGYFRTKEANGAYVWKAHTEYYFEEFNLLIYTVSDAAINDINLEKRAWGSNTDKFNDNGINWKELMDSQVLSIFWKDADRRFIGANNKFLETYGLKNQSEIVGKTDEDMNWNVDEDLFKSDELDVIEKGVVIHNHVGKSVIKGAVRDIVVSKEPVYKDGKIIGLRGYFTEVNNITNGSGEFNNVATSDNVTGLLSANGMLNTIIDYVENYKTNKKKYVLGNVTYGFYSRALNTYGEGITRTILSELGKIYQEELEKQQDHHIVAARIYEDTFILVANYENRNEIEKINQDLLARMKSVHEIAGVPVSLEPVVTLYYCDDYDSEEMISLATNTMNIPEDMPGAMLIYKDDESEEILFASRGLVKLFDCETLDEFKEYTGNSFKGIVHPDDLWNVEADIAKQIRESGDEQIDYVTYKIKTAKGRVKHVEDYGHLVNSPRFGKSYFVFIAEKKENN